MTPEGREKVIAEALTWVNTPYHPQARLKGVGVDCAMLLAEVYANAGIISPVAVGYYSPQFGMHRSEEVFLGFVTQHGVVTQDPQPGDCMLVRFGRCFSHGAILIEPTVVVHASKPAGRVIRSSINEAELIKRPRQFFTVENQL